MAEQALKKDEQQEIATQQSAPAQTAEEAAEKLSMTQEELDALVEKRLARERKKWEKGAKAPAAAPSAAAAVPSQPAAPAVPAVTDQTTARLAQKDREITQARAQLAAMRAGVKPDMVEDAVYLAVKDAEKDGDEADEDGIADALKSVLKRHPDWRTGTDETTKGGFKVGADGSGNGGTAAKPSLPTGRIMF